MKRTGKISATKRYGTLTGVWKKRTTLMNMGRAMYRKQYRASFVTRIAMLLAVLYVVSPFDFIPDFIPFLGWADDGAVLFFLLGRLLTESERFERWLSQFPIINPGSQLQARTD